MEGGLERTRLVKKLVKKLADELTSELASELAVILVITLKQQLLLQTQQKVVSQHVGRQQKRSKDASAKE